jgi:hypothetical protein
MSWDLLSNTNEKINVTMTYSQGDMVEEMLKYSISETLNEGWEKALLDESFCIPTVLKEQGHHVHKMPLRGNKVIYSMREIDWKMVKSNVNKNRKKCTEILSTYKISGKAASKKINDLMMKIENAIKNEHTTGGDDQEESVGDQAQKIAGAAEVLGAL